MGAKSYPTPIDRVSTDIEEVGGKDALTGMIREHSDGMRYILLQSGIALLDKRLIAVDVTNVMVYSTSPSNQFPLGATNHGKTISANSYFWLLYEGTATVLSTASVNKWEPIQGSGTVGPPDTRGRANAGAWSNLSKRFAGFALDDRYAVGSDFYVRMVVRQIAA
jgi:hypothetical protein